MTKTKKIGVITASVALIVVGIIAALYGSILIGALFIGGGGILVYNAINYKVRVHPKESQEAVKEAPIQATPVKEEVEVVLVPNNPVIQEIVKDAIDEPTLYFPTPTVKNGERVIMTEIKAAPTEDKKVAPKKRKYNRKKKSETTENTTKSIKK